MNKINKTLAIVALTVATTFAAQSAKAQESFSAGLPMVENFEMASDAGSDFSISSFDDAAEYDVTSPMDGTVDKGVGDMISKYWKLATDPETAEFVKLVKQIRDDCKGITAEGIMTTLKALGYGTMAAAVGITMLKMIILF